MKIALFIVLGIGTLIVIFQDRLAGLLVNLFYKENDQLTALKQEEALIEGMSPEDAFAKAMLIAQTKGISSQIRSAEWPWEYAQLEFLNWFFKSFDVLTLVPDDRALDYELLKPISINEKRFFVIGEDEFGERYYVVSLETDLVGVYSLEKPDVNNSNIRTYGIEDFEYIASTIPKFVIILNDLFRPLVLESLLSENSGDPQDHA